MEEEMEELYVEGVATHGGRVRRRRRVRMGIISSFRGRKTPAHQRRGFWFPSSHIPLPTRRGCDRDVLPRNGCSHAVHEPVARSSSPGGVEKR